ncbi:hypothetical protein ABZ545_06115 [Streptomyces abikoensis]|uniref:hypothetical protein n=1 Tax=Streptomyces abikoensis TaxID=97398 RepID=UPI0033E4981E
MVIAAAVRMVVGTTAALLQARLRARAGERQRLVEGAVVCAVVQAAGETRLAVHEERADGSKLTVVPAPRLPLVR